MKEVNGQVFLQGQFSEFLRALDNIIVMPEHDSEALCEKKQCQIRNLLFVKPYKLFRLQI